MPKLKESPKQKMDRAFLAAITCGQARRGESNQDTIRLMPEIGRASCRERV